MRRKVLEGNCYIPYKLIKSLSTVLPSNSSTTGENRYEARIEKETVIRIENDVLKRDGYDSIQLKAAVIQASPGKLIFILEPTRAEIMQRKFELNTKLKVYHNRNIFLADEMTYSDKPFHPILHTSYLSPDPTYQAPVTGFDWKMARHWKKPAWTPEEYAEHFANPPIAKVRDRDGYLPMILDNGEKAISVTAKPFDGVDLNPWGSPSKYYIRSTRPMYVLIETRSYFERKYFAIEAGCVLRNDFGELVCTEVQYPFFPYHPVLTVSSSSCFFFSLAPFGTLIVTHSQVTIKASKGFLFSFHRPSFLFRNSSFRLSRPPDHASSTSLSPRDW